jgi:hypothetical protein
MGKPAILAVDRLRYELHMLRNLFGHYPVSRDPYLWPMNARWYASHRPYLWGFPVGHFDSRGHMIGVLTGFLPDGSPVLLRALSGNDQILNDQYWCRPSSNPMIVNSFSHGAIDVTSEYMNTRTHFGHCAASHLLNAALHMAIQIESIAEMWISRGPSLNGRVDGQLQPSCDECVDMFGHMLCDK